MTDKQKVGSACQFHLDGWRYGLIVAVPIKGQRLGMVRVEIPVDLPTKDITTGKWTTKPRPKYWVDAENINEVGDTIYHGRKLARILEERAEKKAAEQAKADKLKAKARRFHR